MFKYSIVVEVSPDMSFKSMEELAEAIKLWRGVRNVELQNASQQSVQSDVCPTCEGSAEGGSNHEVGYCHDCGGTGKRR